MNAAVIRISFTFRHPPPFVNEDGLRWKKRKRNERKKLVRQCLCPRITLKIQESICEWWWLPDPKFVLPHDVNLGSYALSASRLD